MIIWFPFSVVAILLAYCSTPNNTIVANYAYYRPLLIIWLAWFVSFGSVQATDHITYMEWYEGYDENELFGIIELFKLHISSITEGRDGTEIGYVFLNILFNKLGFSFVGFLFCYALIVNYLLVTVIYRYKYPVFAVLVLIASNHFSQQANLVRQMMAVSIFLYATKYILEKKALFYFLSIFLASLFHFSALILIPFYYFADKNISKAPMIIVWIGSLLVVLLNLQIPFLSRYEVPIYNITLQTLDRDIETSGLNLAYNFFIFLIIFLKEKYWEHNKKYVLSINLFYFGVILTNLIPLTFHFYRISLFFTMFMITIIPQLPNIVKDSTPWQNVNDKSLYKVLRFALVVFYVSILYRQFRSELTVGLGAEMYSLTEIFK